MVVYDFNTTNMCLNNIFVKLLFHWSYFVFFSFHSSVEHEKLWRNNELFPSVLLFFISTDSNWNYFLVFYFFLGKYDFQSIFLTKTCFFQWFEFDELISSSKFFNDVHGISTIIKRRYKTVREPIDKAQSWNQPPGVI